MADPMPRAADVSEVTLSCAVDSSIPGLRTSECVEAVCSLSCAEKKF